jgi:hypothetical protein
VTVHRGTSDEDLNQGSHPFGQLCSDSNSAQSHRQTANRGKAVRHTVSRRARPLASVVIGLALRPGSFVAMAPTEEASNVLLGQLKWVHSLVRGELQACRELARDVAIGASSEDVRARVEALQTRGPLFQLRVNCLYYCRFVHSHHGHEDASLFPAVRRAAPDLATVVDKLEADHRRVSDLLDAVETAAKQLGDPADVAVRPLLVDALDELSRHLLEHLAYEEEVLAPVLGSWDYWPF